MHRSYLFLYDTAIHMEVMHIRLGLFSRKPEGKKGNGGRPRYVSGLQKDIRKYEGWTKDEVESDYRVSKSVHTILTIGYMEYCDDVLVLTDRGRLLMQNVGDAIPLADRSE